MQSISIPAHVCYYCFKCYVLLMLNTNYVMLCYVMLCYAMLCYAMLFYVMLCYVMLICYITANKLPVLYFISKCASILICTHVS